MLVCGGFDGHITILQRSPLEEIWFSDAKETKLIPETKKHYKLYYCQHVLY